MLGCPTPTVQPFFGPNDRGPKGAVPVNGDGFCPAAGPAATACAPGKGNNGGGGGASGSAGGGGGGPPGAATAPGSGAGSSGSASAGPAPSTSAKPTTEANPAAFRAAKRRPRFRPDICIPPVTFLD